MKITMWNLVLYQLFLLFQEGWCFSNFYVSVPQAVLAGKNQSVIIKCAYELRGSKLLIMAFQKTNSDISNVNEDLAVTEFYRYLANSTPPRRIDFPLHQASVDMTQSDDHQVRLVNLHRHLSGIYICLVVSDFPAYSTVGAPLVVVEPPTHDPHIEVSRNNYTLEAEIDIIRANCSVNEAYPQATLSWKINGLEIAKTKTSYAVTKTKFEQKAAFSELMLLIDNDVTFDEIFDYGDDDTKVLRYRMKPPVGMNLDLSCEASILDVYKSNSEVVRIQDTSAGFLVCANVFLIALCFWAVLGFKYEFVRTDF